jgi:hypothetical protein
MGFKEYLMENASFDIDGALEVIKPYLSAKILAEVVANLDLLKSALETSSIYNSDFEAIKQSFSRVQGAYQKLYYDDAGGAWFTYDSSDQRAGLNKFDTTPYIDGGNYKKQVKQLEQAVKVSGLQPSTVEHLQKMQALLNAYAVLQDALKSLKPHIIKGRKPAVSKNPNEFRSKMGSQDSQAIISKHLLDNITEALDKYEANVISYFEKIVSQLKDEEEVFGHQLSADPARQQVLQNCFTFKHETYRKDRKLDIKYTELKLDASYHAWIAREAASIRKGIQDGFMHKNLTKLSLIVDKKGNLESIKGSPNTETKVNGVTGTMQAELVFTFADSSSFRVLNKIIVNTSSSGKGFYQYPTTFHDVKLPDGSKLSMPSEEKMVKVFAETKA